MTLTNTHSTHLGRQLFTLIAGSVMLASPLLWATETSAQAEAEVLVSQSSAISATSAQNGTLYLNEDRAYSYNLEVESGTRVNGLYLPPGAIIRGQYEPAGEEGLRYTAYAVEMNGRSYNLNATSGVIEAQTDPRDTSGGSIAEDAAIGAAGGALLGEVFGSIDAGEVIGGAVAGGAVGRVTADQVVVIEPDQPITLYTP